MKLQILITTVSVVSLCVSIFALRIRSLELNAIENIIKQSTEGKKRTSTATELENRIDLGEDSYWKDKLDKTITIGDVIKLINNR